MGLPSLLKQRQRDAATRVAVAEERSRIACELHDVVAHSVSTMVLQTSAVRRRLEGEHEIERNALLAIEQTGREALAEMRRFLRVIREEGEGVELAPQPGLGSVGTLVEQIREDGLPVELRIEGEPASLPAGVDLSAYRIVQEGLTKALRQPGPARAEVVLRYGSDAIEVEVSDDGIGAPDTDGTGLGLTRIRERVKLYGGALEAGRRPGGGYVLRARIPVRIEGA